MGKTQTALPYSENREPLVYQRRRTLLVLAGIVVVLALATVYHYAIYLPQPRVPHRLTLLDDVFALGVLGLVGLVGLLVGLRLLRPFKLTGFSWVESGALAVGLGWGLLSLAVLALGLAHLLYGWLLFGGLALVLAFFWRDAWRILSLLASGAPYRRLRACKPRGFFLWALAVIVCLELILLGTHSLTIPNAPRGFDIYQYHWAVPQLYLLHHAIYALPGWAHANFPFNSEMLNTLALACGSQEAAVFIQGAFGLLAIILIVGFLYRRFGFLAAWLGAALSICNNLVAGLLVSGYAELAVTFYAVASLVVVLAWLDQREQTAGMPLLVLAGLFAGFGLGAKYTEGQVIVGIALLLIGVGVIRLVGPRRQGKPLLPAFGRLLADLMIYGAAILLAVLPWLLKDWVLLGNPIYPFIWGGPEWDAARTETGVLTLSHFGPQGPAWQRLLTGFFTLFTETGHTDDPPYVPPNYLYLLVLLVPLVWAVEQARWRRRKRVSSTGLAERGESAGWGQPWLVVAAGGYVVWLLLGAAVARYGLPWLILLSVPSAVLLARACGVRWQQPFLRLLAPMMRFMTPAAMLFAAGIAVAFSVPIWAYTNPLPMVVGNISLRQWEEQGMMDSGFWHMVDYVEEHVPHDARLLLVGRGVGYFLPDFDYVADSGEDWIPYLETEGRTPAGMLALLRQDHFRYLIFDEQTLSFIVHGYGNYYVASFLPAFRQFLAGSLIQVWSYQNFHVYQLPAP